MISGMKAKKISRYLPISHGDEIYGFVEPKDGEEFIGYPYAWLSDNSYPFIEVVVNGETVRSINLLDISEIEFSI